jgi:hypothetical protein
MKQMDIRRLREMKFMRYISRYSLLERKNEDILKKSKADPVEKIYYEQNMLNRVKRMATLDNQNNSVNNGLSEMKIWTTIKETTRRIHLGG